MIQVNDLSAGYAKTPVINNVSFSVKRGSITAIIGPNGCGKSTLAKCIARHIRPVSGKITWNGKQIDEYLPREYARLVSFLSQGKGVASISVEGLVMHGRYPHLGFSRRLTQADYDIVNRAMGRTGTHELKDKMLFDLSGGERQRAYIAMALAQESELIVLDEPTTYLDICHQLDLLDMLRVLRDEGKTIVVILHDLNQAIQLADQVCLLDRGRIVFSGSPNNLIENDCIDQTFRVDKECINVDGSPWLIIDKRR